MEEETSFSTPSEIPPCDSRSSSKNSSTETILAVVDGVVDGDRKKVPSKKQVRSEEKPCAVIAPGAASETTCEANSNVSGDGMGAEAVADPGEGESSAYGIFARFLGY